jgi:myo-inositol-1-phosphate synthase
LRKSKVRVGIVGVGNCASSFVQGLSHYARAETNAPIPGLMHPDLGGYAIDDIEISAAFDVNAAKVGRDVGEAIFVAPNNTQRFAQVSPTGVVVHRGRTLDGLGKYNREEIEEADGEPADVTDVLQRSRTDVVVSYLPVGSSKRRNTTPNERWKPAAPSSTASPFSSPPTPTGAAASSSAACRSSVTTSKARSAPRSSIACSPTCSASAASASTAPTS